MIIKSHAQLRALISDLKLNSEIESKIVTIFEKEIKRIILVNVKEVLPDDIAKYFNSCHFQEVIQDYYLSKEDAGTTRQ